MTVKPLPSSSSSVGVAIASISGTMRRPLALDHRSERRAVQHVDHVRAVRDVHRRRIRIAIDCDHFAAEALQLDHHFLPSSPEPSSITRLAEGASGVPIVVMVVSLERECDALSTA